jgi:translocation and assembly module TamB
MEKLMKKRTAAVLFLSPTFLFIFLCTAWIYLVHPYLKSWTLQQVSKINSNQPYVDISVQDIDLSILKLQAQAKNINIVFKENGPDQFLNLGSVHIDLIKAQVDLFSLIVGQLSLSNVLISQLRSEQDLTPLLKLLPEQKSKPTELNLEPFIKLLDNIPIQKITLHDSSIDLNISPIQDINLKRVRTRIHNMTLSQNRKKISIQTQDMMASFENQQNKESVLNLSIKADLTEKSYNISQLQLKSDASEISISSSTNDLTQILLHPKITSTFKAQLRLDELKDLVYIFKKQKQRLPQVSGLIRMNGQFSTSELLKNNGFIQISTEEVRLENLKLGTARATSQIKDGRFLIDSVLVEHPAGRAELKNISIQQQKPFTFKTDVNVQGFRLQKFFESLNLKNIPAEVMKADAKAQCTGQIDNFEVRCSTQINAEKISVKTDLNKPFHIVEIEKAMADGDVELNLHEFRFKSDLKVGASTIHGIGEVQFETGFKMNFTSKSLNLSEIENIANLGLRGIASGELSTSGNSSYGIIDTKDLQIQDLVIDKFYLGNVQTDLKYAMSKLSFNNSTAELNKSKYSGNVAIDFSKSAINGQLQLKTLFAEDVLSAVEQRWSLPISAAGAGTGKIQFSGPLDFWKMSYKLDAQFQNGHLMDESFQKLKLDINSNGDKINFENVTLYKANGSVSILNDILTDSTHKTPQFNLQIKSHNLRAEEIEHFSRLLPTANGIINLNGTITSDILNPLVILQTQTKDMKVDQYALPTSQGEARLSLQNFKFNGQIFGRQLQVDLNVPFVDTEKFWLKAQARDFNPLLLLPMINLTIPASDTYSSISADIDLNSATSAISNLSGSIKIENILLQRSSLQLKLKQPATILFQRGLKQMEPVELIGTDQNLSVSLKNGTASELKIDGHFFLRPFQFLVPFLDNLSGVAEINCFIDLNSSNINLSGEGLIDNTSVSVKGFKYPLNDITAYFDFTKSKIIFSEIIATLNQASLTGQGQIDIKGSKNIDVQLNAETSKLDIEFPDKYFTSGAAQIKFFGNWLPYTLKIDYLVDEGNITKEFSEEDGDAIFSLRPSPYLPPQQLNQKNQSLLLNVNVDFMTGVAIKNRIVEGIATGKIHVAGSPENPILQGRVDIQQGSRLLFKDKLFDIQQGHVTFNGEYIINPTVFMTANARVSDYDINLLIQGTAKNLDIKPTSQPDLSREDIISLLALGYTSTKNDQALSSDVQQKQTGLEVLAALSNQSQLNKKLQEKLGLNVQLSPSIDSTRNIAVPKVTVSKKLTNKITTSYSRPLAGDQQENEIRLQYLWAKDLSLILNYQNQNSAQQTNILQNTNSETGVGGIDLEYKKEFGE